MEKGNFEKNRKKSRRMALVITVLFHIMILGGLWLTTSDEDSSVKALVNQILGGDNATTTDESYAQP